MEQHRLSVRVPPGAAGNARTDKACQHVRQPAAGRLAFGR